MSGQNKTSRVLLALAIWWLLLLVVVPLWGEGGSLLEQSLRGESSASIILWQIRLPRVLLGLLVGGMLALSGLSFQTLFRNPLAEPYTLGVAGGAALGAVLALPFEGSLGAWGLPVVATASFLGALGVTFVLLGLTKSRLGREHGTLLLAGIAISLTCSALILLLQALADFTQTFRIVRWMMGGLAVVGYGEVLWLVPWFVLGGLTLIALRWDLNLLLSGEEVAASRGVDLSRLRWTVLGTASLMVGALVAVAGPIGFVGLIVPHILRRLLGHDHLHLIPGTLLAGGIFLATCDLVARRVLAPVELPVGVLTALLGGPFFLWLLIRRR